MTKISDSVKLNMMSLVKLTLEASGEEVLQVKSGTFSIPWAIEDEEGYINVTFSVPKGSRDGEGYDGHSEAENYALETKTKAEKKAEAEARKKKKIAKDKLEREK